MLYLGLDILDEQPGSETISLLQAEGMSRTSAPKMEYEDDFTGEDISTASVLTEGDLKKVPDFLGLDIKIRKTSCEVFKFQSTSLLVRLFVSSSSIFRSFKRTFLPAVKYCKDSNFSTRYFAAASELKKKAKSHERPFPSVGNPF